MEKKDNKKCPNCGSPMHVAGDMKIMRTPAGLSDKRVAIYQCGACGYQTFFEWVLLRWRWVVAFAHRCCFAVGDNL